jgi:glycosyltransferase involved in cell wall biosynthesis
LLGLPTDGFVAGWVGRLTSEKGADVLLEGLTAVRDLPLRVSVVGTGGQLPALRSRAEALGLGAVLTWHGAVPDAERIMAAFDVFVLSSRTEGTPIVLFEAMAAGVPIVATRVGGVPDVLAEREALLVPPEQPGALADALRAVFADPASAAGRTQAAQEALHDRFGVEPWLDAYVRIYAAVAGGSH